MSDGRKLVADLVVAAGRPQRALLHLSAGNFVCNANAHVHTSRLSCVRAIEGEEASSLPGRGMPSLRTMRHDSSSPRCLRESRSIFDVSDLTMASSRSSVSSSCAIQHASSCLIPPSRTPFHVPCPDLYLYHHHAVLLVHLSCHPGHQQRHSYPAPSAPCSSA